MNKDLYINKTIYFNVIITHRSVGKMLVIRCLMMFTVTGWGVGWGGEEGGGGDGEGGERR